MLSSHFSKIGLLCCMTIFGGCLFLLKNQDFTIPQQTQIPVIPILESPITPQLAELTPQQKIAQLLAVSITLTNTPKSTAAATKQIQDMTEFQPGFVVIYGKKLDFTTVKTATEKISALSPTTPITVAIDHEGGVVQRLTGVGFTPVDAWNVLCETDQATRIEIFEKTAKELKTAGITLVLGPTLDSASSSSKALKTRLCQADTSTLVKSAQEVVTIYRNAGITATLKHYPGIGSLKIDLHDHYAEITDTSREQPLFHQLLQQNPTIAVMTSHAGLLDSDTPCSINKTCLQPLQRYQQNLIITDDVDMKATLENTPEKKLVQLSEITRKAIEAGNTVVLLGPNILPVTVQQIIDELSLQYATDVTFANQVDQRVKKIMLWKNQAMNNLPN